MSKTNLKMMKFNPLFVIILWGDSVEGFIYGQTEYNILSNALKLKDYVYKAKEFAYKSLTITDPNLHGYFKFYSLCNKNNIKPIIGLEVLVLGDKNTTFLCYAKNNEGFSNLIKLENPSLFFA